MTLRLEELRSPDPTLSELLPAETVYLEPAHPWSLPVAHRNRRDRHHDARARYREVVYAGFARWFAVPCRITGCFPEAPPPGSRWREGESHELASRYVYDPRLDWQRTSENDDRGETVTESRYSWCPDTAPRHELSNATTDLLVRAFKESITSGSPLRLTNSEETMATLWGLQVASERTVASELAAIHAYLSGPPDLRAIRVEVGA